MEIRIAFPLALTLIAGCADMSGLGGGSKFACKAPAGVHCESLSATYHNSLANNLPAQQPRAPSPDKTSGKTGGEAPGGRDAGMAPSPGFAPMALRAPGREMRIWIKAWQDDDKDLADQSYVYLVATEGHWRVSHVQRKERDAVVRPAPPASTAAPDSTPPVPPNVPPGPMAQAAPVAETGKPVDK